MFFINMMIIFTQTNQNFGMTLDRINTLDRIFIFDYNKTFFNDELYNDMGKTMIFINNKHLTLILFLTYLFSKL